MHTDGPQYHEDNDQSISYEPGNAKDHRATTRTSEDCCPMKKSLEASVNICRWREDLA